MSSLKLYQATLARTGAKMSDILVKPVSFFREYRKEKLRVFCNEMGLLHDDVMFNDYDPVAWESLKRIDPAHHEMRVRRWLRAIDLHFKGKVLPEHLQGQQGDPLDINLMYMKDTYFKVKQEFIERETFEDRFK